MKRSYILTGSSNRGIGLWTMICVYFACIFGVKSKNYDKKRKMMLAEAKQELLVQFSKLPAGEYTMADFRVVHATFLDVTVSAVAVLAEHKEEKEQGKDFRIEGRDSIAHIVDSYDTQIPNTVIQEEDVEQVIGEVTNDSLMNTGKVYIKPKSRKGKTYYWNNHVRGEEVRIEVSIGEIPAGSIGRVLGVTEDGKIDVQFRTNNKNVVITTINQNLTVIE